MIIRHNIILLLLIIIVFNELDDATVLFALYLIMLPYLCQVTKFQ